VKVDLDPTPGQFLLTGSSRVLALRTLPDALPGRMEVIELWPFAGRDQRRTRPVCRRCFPAWSGDRTLVVAAPAGLSQSHCRRWLPRGGTPRPASSNRVLRLISVHFDRTRCPGAGEYRTPWRPAH